MVRVQIASQAAWTTAEALSEVREHFDNLPLAATGNLFIVRYPISARPAAESRTASKAIMLAGKHCSPVLIYLIIAVIAGRWFGSEVPEKG